MTETNLEALEAYFNDGSEADRRARYWNVLESRLGSPITYDYTPDGDAVLESLSGLIGGGDALHGHVVNDAWGGGFGADAERLDRGFLAAFCWGALSGGKLQVLMGPPNPHGTQVSVRETTDHIVVEIELGTGAIDVILRAGQDDQDGDGDGEGGGGGESPGYKWLKAFRHGRDVNLDPPLHPPPV